MTIARPLSLLVAGAFAASLCVTAAMAEEAGHADHAAHMSRAKKAGPTAQPKGPIATATLVAADGSAKGLALLSGKSGQWELTVTVEGLPAGVHGAHLHTVGKCEGPDFTTAGGHLNPQTKQHGKDNPMGAHLGDLPNVTVGEDGKGTLTATLTGTAAEMFDADGTSVVIHAGTDDYKTDPSGNSGGRIACGVLTKSR